MHFLTGRVCAGNLSASNRFQHFPVTLTSENPIFIAFGRIAAFLWTSYSDSGIILRMVFLINIFAGVFGVVTARNRHAGGDPLPPQFYQTKPFVMLRKSYLCGTGISSCVDYRKMTNGFVFVILMPNRITLRASKRREAVLRLPKALGFWK